MKIFILWLIEFIIEFSMFHLWWVKVYMYGRKSNMTKIKLIKDSCAFFCYLCHQKRSDQTVEDKKRLSLYFIEGLIIIVMGMGVIPFVFAFVFARAEVILQIIFVLIFSGVQYDVLKKWPIAKGLDKYIDFLKKYQKIRSGRDEKFYSETDTDSVPIDRKSILDNKTVSVIVALAIIATASILIYYRVCSILNDIKHPKSTGIQLFINFNEIEKVALFALCAVILLVVILDAINLCKRKRKEISKNVLRQKNSINLKKTKDSIIIGSELTRWKDDIFQMCKHLHVKSVHVYINNSVQDIAEATRQKKGIAHIQISRYYFADMRQYFDEHLFKKVLMFIIGHELAHIYFNDRSKGQTAAIRITIFGGYMLCLCETAMLIYRYDLMQSVIFWVWAVSAIYFLLFVVSVIIDARYWGQIKELRADRVGMEVSSTSPDVFDAFASYCQHNLNGDSNETDNVIYFFYKQYVELEDHPSLKRRSIELHRNKGWGITEHIRYCWMIRWKSWRCRGWKL